VHTQEDIISLLPGQRQYHCDSPDYYDLQMSVIKTIRLCDVNLLKTLASDPTMDLKVVFSLLSGCYP